MSCGCSDVSADPYSQISTALGVSLGHRKGIRHTMSEALTPEQDTIETGDEEDRPDEEYGGPDPEEDEKGDGADEDQGT
jgi:hypothetical protein